MRHLKAFHTFHIAASSFSFSDAAAKLHITHGAVSKQIKILENYLGMSLFYKEGRKAHLTQEGKLLLQYTEEAFRTLETGVKRAKQLNNNYLEVSCEPTLTMRWLMPRLSEFNDLSGLDIRLSTAGGPVTLGATGLSMAIRRDDFVLSDEYIKQPLVEEWVGPVMSKEYWDSVSNDPSKLLLLHSQTRPQAWAAWLKATDQPFEKTRQEQTFAHFYFCFQAAVDGLGAALGSYPLVVDDLKRGRLIAPYGFIRSGHRYIAISDPSMVNGNQTAFSNWIAEQLAVCIPERHEMGQGS